MKGPEPIIVGGVSIYAPAQKKGLFNRLFGKKDVKVLPKEGDLNVVIYKGMTIKFPDQNKDIDVGNRKRRPTIYDYNGKTELFLNKAEINGSNNDDKVISHCKDSIFNFKSGGNDVISHVSAFKDADDMLEPQLDGNTFNIGEEDMLKTELRFYHNNELKEELDTEYIYEDGEFIINDRKLETY